MAERSAVLDNLTQVTQGVQTRTFSYDSLGRLRQAVNPEIAGTVTYTYDIVGNLTGKATPGATTAMEYDGLNRLALKSYTPATTPTVKLCYDGQAISGGACAGLASTGAKLHVTQSYTSDSTTSYTYDSQGRLSSNTQLTSGLTAGHLLSASVQSRWVAKCRS